MSLGVGVLFASWGEEESNLRRLRQQIYSLPHLTALVSPRKLIKPVGADGRTRTADLLITNQQLYQLSYIGIKNSVELSSSAPVADFETSQYVKKLSLIKRTAKV